MHFDDVRKLLEVLHRLTDLGNTVVIIEHNLDVIRNADWILDLGPEGGEDGGRIVAEGRPVVIATTPGSFTGEFLSRYYKDLSATEFKLLSSVEIAAETVALNANPFLAKRAAHKAKKEAKSAARPKKKKAPSALSELAEAKEKKALKDLKKAAAKAEKA